MKIQVAGQYPSFSEKKEKEIVHQVILTGDAARNNKGLDDSMTIMMSQLFEQVGENSTMLMLGDNIQSISQNKYPKSFNTKSNVALIDLIKKFKGKTYFLPGDMEWQKNDQVGVNQIEKWIQTRVFGKDNFIPDDGCPGPEVEILSDNLALIALDSRWFIENWNTTAEHNESCEIRDREQFLLEIVNEIKRYYGKYNIIIALHHPVFSSGYRGGFTSVKDHIFPFKINNGTLPIPLPVVGSLISLFRKKIPARQDILHPDYQVLAKYIDNLNRNYPGLIVVSAHENNLQLHRDKTQHYVVSGSLTSKAPATLADSTLFSYGGKGVSMLNIYEDGEVEVEFIKPDINNIPEVIFRKKLIDPSPTVAELMPNSFPVYEERQDSITTQILTNTKILDYSEFAWGELNTDLYYTKIKMAVMDLDTALGGLTPFRRGGSFQTKSIRLRDNDGQLYHLRSLKKSPDKILPYPLNKTFALNILKKQMTAANPFAAFTLTPLQKSIGVLHSNPRLVYLPKQPALKEYNDLGNAVYLFEERPDEDWSSLDSYGNSKNIISHFNMRQDLLDNHRAKVDQPLTLRTRLFDMIIGDWDRHEDQWRWASFEDEEGNVLYKPIARDRDQAFPIYGGLVHTLLQTTTPEFRSLQRFEKILKDTDIKWLNKQAANFDRLYLNSLDWDDWEKQVKHIQNTLTDEVIHEAMNLFPNELKSKGLNKDIAENLKTRRDDLLRIAKVYYKLLTKEIHIPATQKDNLVEVERVDNERSKILIYEYRKGKKEKDLIYERVILNLETSSVICYGLDGDDEFRVIGDVDKGIKIRMVGGNGVDSFEDYSSVKGFTKKTIFYDDKNEKTILSKSGETAKKISNQYKFNHYKFKGYHHNYGFLVPSFDYDQDQGFRFITTYFARNYSYKKVQDHRLSASYAFGNGGSEFSYFGVYSDVFGSAAMVLDAKFFQPKLVYNFYGLGNETENLFDGSEYYRVQQEGLNLGIGLRKYLDVSQNSFFDIVPSFERIKIRNQDDVFLSENTDILDPVVFTDQNFAGLKVSFDYNSVDRPTFPRRGLKLQAAANWRNKLGNDINQFVQLSGNLTLYQKLGSSNRAVFASQIGFVSLFGDFNFYNAARLGGNNNLRGFANERFTGRSSFYHNNDFRIRLLKTKIAKVPTSCGITLGFDYGRVWIEDDNSDKWHKGYGAHLWFSPFEYFVISSGMFFSEEENRFSLRFGFHF